MFYNAMYSKNLNRTVTFMQHTIETKILDMMSLEGREVKMTIYVYI